MAVLPRAGDAEAARVRAELEGPRGSVGAMWEALLHAPSLAERMGALGQYFRFGSSATLPDDARETVILATAAQRGSSYVWFHHEPYARGAHQGAAGEARPHLAIYPP